MQERKGAPEDVRRGSLPQGTSGAADATTASPPPRRTKRERPTKARGRQARKPAKTGPRGGTTTITESGMVKKNLWIPAEVAEELRQRAFDERRSEADIIREGLELVLGDER